MKVAIHQPNYIPYIGYFQKMALADTFVILDTVQFSNGCPTQRTKIRTKESWMWLTVPVEKKYHFSQIKDIFLSYNAKWLQKHRLSIISNYSNCKFFDAKFVDEYFNNVHPIEKLQDFNEFGIFYLKEKFGIKTEVIKASDLDINSDLKSTNLILDIVNNVGGDVYISGTGGKNYLCESKFPESNIKLEYFQFQSFEYPQRWNGFEPFCTALDILFNLGSKNATALLKNSSQN